VAFVLYSNIVQYLSFLFVILDAIAAGGKGVIIWSTFFFVVVVSRLAAHSHHREPLYEPQTHCPDGGARDRPAV
jgi:hypothetical protein